MKIESPRNKTKAAPHELTPEQEDLLSQLLLDYAIWHESNQEQLEREAALEDTSQTTPPRDKPPKKPRKKRTG